MINTPIFSFVTPNSSITACIPATPIELPHVDMKPVTATVMDVRHFALADQFRALAGEVEKFCSVRAASRADSEVSELEMCFNGGNEGLGPLDSLDGGSAGTTVGVGDGISSVVEGFSEPVRRGEAVAMSELPGWVGEDIVGLSDIMPVPRQTPYKIELRTAPMLSERRILSGSSMSLEVLYSSAEAKYRLFVTELPKTSMAIADHFRRYHAGPKNSHRHAHVT